MNANFRRVPMEWFGIHSDLYPFTMFSITHLLVIFVLLIIATCIYIRKDFLKGKDLRRTELSLAVSLIIIEALYQLWMVVNDIWHVNQSLPFELCNIGLILCILLLLNEKKLIYELLLFVALLGASHAILTPELYLGFPHFRFFHFFYTHILMILTVLYFTWVKGYRPTLHSVGKIIIFLNILLPLILVVNHMTGGNYMFLRYKPGTSSLLDVLGPHPWYIFSLELLLVLLSLGVWFIFRDRKGG
jgi:hypothetical integral membrane protein (TIGR02206 family)